MTHLPEAGLGTKLRHLLALLDDDVQAVYDELGVPFRPRFYPIVQQLLRHDECGVTALAEAVGVSQPAMTQTLAEMRKLGLLSSSPGEDPRQRLTRLTDSGRELAGRLERVWRATTASAAELEAETRLSDAVDRARAALARRPFKDRIKERM